MYVAVRLYFTLILPRQDYANTALASSCRKVESSAKLESLLQLELDHVLGVPLVGVVHDVLVHQQRRDGRLARGEDLVRVRVRVIVRVRVRVRTRSRRRPGQGEKNGRYGLSRKRAWVRVRVSPAPRDALGI